MTQYQELAANNEAARIKKIADTPFEELTATLQRRVIFESQNGACNKCGNTHWLGELIPLELEHKNGEHHDNRRDNVELLCPNCHAMTDTYRGRNKRKNMGRISDEQIVEALKTTPTIRQALLAVGLAAKGNNYVRAKRLAETL